MRALLPLLRQGTAAEGQIPPAIWRALEVVKFSTETASQQGEGTSVLFPWLSNSWISAPVAFVDGQEPPTALSWLRRRGPGVPDAYLHRLFRERQIRVFNGSQVKAVKKGVVLDRGYKLLVMKKRLAEFRDEPSREAKPEPKVIKRNAAEFPGQWNGASLWKRLLYQDKEMMVFNKPEGLATQDGKGVRVSVDSILRQRAQERGWDAPKLVHRLDKDTSGVLAVAKNADAASWMAEAFRERSSNDGNGVFRVRKTYWAITQAGPALQLRGTVKRDIVAHGNKLPAETLYFCKEISQGLALLRLHPITGRKHQLRIHCTCALGSPILGDDLYRQRKEEDQVLAPLDVVCLYLPTSYRDHQTSIPVMLELRKAGALGKMHLHAGTLVLGKPGKKPIKIVAPPPRHMVEVCKTLGWRCNMN